MDKSIRGSSSRSDLMRRVRGRRVEVRRVLFDGEVADDDCIGASRGLQPVGGRLKHQRSVRWIELDGYRRDINYSMDAGLSNNCGGCNSCQEAAQMQDWQLRWSFHCETGRAAAALVNRSTIH